MRILQSTAIALAGAVLLASPVFAANTDSPGTTSGPAAGSNVTNSIPATPHQAEALKGNNTATAAAEPSSMDAKHVPGKKGAESGKAVVK